MLKGVLGVSSVTGSSQEQTTAEQNVKQRKKYAFIYNDELYESGNRRGRNLGNLGHAIIYDAAKNLNWSKSDAAKFRADFLTQGGTGWLRETIIFDDEVKALSSLLTDDKPCIEYRGVKKVGCIQTFRDVFFSYMDNTDNNYDEQRAKDNFLTVKLTDGICFVARFWGAYDIERLIKTLNKYGYNPSIKRQE